MKRVQNGVDEGTVIVNMPLFRLIGLYQMLDDGGAKVAGRNAFSTFVVAVIVLSASADVVSVLTGLLGDDGRRPNDNALYQQILFYANNGISAFKLLMIVSRAGAIRAFFDVSRADFLRSSPCRNADARGRLMVRSRVQSTTLTGYYFWMFVVTIIMWTSVPWMLVGGWSPDVRHPNALNLNYPYETVQMHNQWFGAFYALEATMAVLTAYGIVVFDVFLMSFCWAISAQYDTVAAAFEQFTDHVHDSGDGDDKMYYYNMLRSIISDSQQIYEKLQKFYGVIRPVVLIQVVVSSCSVVVLTILIVLNYTSRTSVSTAENSKYITTLLSLAVELFLYCSLIESLNDKILQIHLSEDIIDEMITVKKESINSRMYGCDWTKMDLRTKNLLLFAVKMNNANHLMIKATPNKLIDRRLFVNVMHTSYSLISVLLNTNKN